MKVSDLAGELKITVKQAMALTGKPHNAELDEAEVAKAAAEYQAQETPAAKTRGIVRFWSEVMNHSFPVRNPRTGEQQLVYFSEFKLDTEKGSVAYKAVVDLDEPDIRIVVDKPFEDIGEAKAFREMLETKVYTGPQREAGAVRGMGFLMALFSNDELPDAARTLHKHGVAGVIELAIRRKSYVPATKEG